MYTCISKLILIILTGLVILIYVFIFRVDLPAWRPSASMTTFSNKDCQNKGRSRIKKYIVMKCSPERNYAKKRIKESVHILKPCVIHIYYCSRSRGWVQHCTPTRTFTDRLLQNFTLHVQTHENYVTIDST